jgi:hypothetical protein
MWKLFLYVNFRTKSINNFTPQPPRKYNLSTNKSKNPSTSKVRREVKCEEIKFSAIYLYTLQHKRKCDGEAKKVVVTTARRPNYSAYSVLSAVARQIDNIWRADLSSVTSYFSTPFIIHFITLLALRSTHSYINTAPLARRRAHLSANIQPTIYCLSGMWDWLYDSPVRGEMEIEEI